MVSAGNHEKGSNFTHYENRFSMPRKEVTNNHYYALDLGPVHLLAYNTEAFFWPKNFDEAYVERMWAWMDRVRVGAFPNPGTLWRPDYG
jgi:hypothetical protein